MTSASEDPTSSPGDAVEGISIGNLSRATGIPIATLRTWERRHGFPRPLRRASGHRRYTPDAIVGLRLVRAAILAGMRPGEAIPAPAATLRAYLAAAGVDESGLDPQASSQGRAQDSPSIFEQVEGLIELVRGLDGPGLDRELHRASQTLGAQRFVLDLVAPLMREIGERWARNDLDIGHEHFASERVRELLVEIWRPLSDRTVGDAVVLACLSDEEHALGLHMAAVLLALRNHRVVFLGAGTPATEIESVSRQCKAAMIAIGSSPHASATAIRPALIELRKQTPGRTQILLGGLEQDPLLSGVCWLRDLRALASWLDRE